jgi:hypothetical protein
VKDSTPNHYEKAFAGWLIENQVEFVSTADQRKPVFENSELKSFDFLLCPRGGRKIIAEVKGRHFKGTALTNLSGLECWVTTEDYDGREIFDFYGDRYLFLAVRLADYIQFMKQRSPKWRTVTLAAEKFRLCAQPVRGLFV